MAQSTTSPDISDELATLQTLLRWPHAVQFVIDQRQAGVDWTLLRARLLALIRVPVQI